MKSRISQIVEALDRAKSIALKRIDVEGSIVRFVVSEDSGEPRSTTEDEIEKWLTDAESGSQEYSPG